MTTPADGLLARWIDEVTLGADKVYPNLANGVSVTTDEAPWALSVAFVQIIPAATITRPFVIVSAHFYDEGGLASEYQANLYYGASDTSLARVRFAFDGGTTLTQRVNLFGGAYPVPIPANSRVRCKMAAALAALGSSGTVRVRLGYREVQPPHGADGLYTRRTAQVVLGGELVYPNQDSGALLTSGAANWALGAVTEIVPAAEIEFPFVITRVYFNGTVVEVGEYQLDLFFGNPDVALCSVPLNEEYFYQSVNMRGGAWCCNTGGFQDSRSACLLP